MATQHFFFGDKWLGSRVIPDFADLGAGSRVANSYALFCPHCAVVWGRLMHDRQGAFCQPVISCCLKHATFPSDATFTSTHGRYAAEGGPRDWSDDLPLPIMAHDIAALCNYYLAHPEKIFLIRNQT